MGKKATSNLVKGWFVAFLAILFLFNINIVFAGSVDSVLTVRSGMASLSSICSESNKVVNVDILRYDAVNGVLTFSNANYSELEYSDKKDFMEYSLLAVKKSNLPSKEKNKVYNFIANQDEAITNALNYLKNDTNADFVSAKKWFAPFSGVISTIMGVLCIVITIGLSFSMLFDSCYIVIPMFQLLVDREEGKKPWGVSTEAWKSQKEVESEGKYRSTVLGMYLKRRIPVFITIAIILGWLVSGKIYDIIVWIVSAFNN